MKIRTIILILTTMLIISSCEDSSVAPSNKPEVNVPTEGLVAYYPFWNKAIDESPNDNDGTLYGTGACFPSNCYPSCVARCFDGINDYIKVQDSESLDLESAVSLSAWFRTESARRGQTIVGKGETPGTNVYWLSIVEPYQVCFGIRMTSFGTGVFEIIYSHDESLLDGEWHSIVGTFYGAILKLYLDGQLVGTKELSESTNICVSDEPIYIGRGQQDFYYFNGQLDEICIYNRELTESEIQILQNHEMRLLD